MIEKNFNLKAYNTFGLTVHCAEFASFESADDIEEIIRNKKSRNLLILGGGSNLLFTKNYDGLIMHNNLRGISTVEETEDEITLECGAGEVWHQFVLYTISKHYGGIENLSLIPGRVGASPMQNIGAYGVELKDVFVYLEAYHISSGEIHRFDNSDCKFGYRESIFKNKLKDQYIILKVGFRLKKNPSVNTSYGIIEKKLLEMQINSPTIKDVSDAIISIRSSKLPDPNLIGNAGSFFKNPVVDSETAKKLKKKYPTIPNYPTKNNDVKIAAGWLIEQAGWKGYKEKDFGVHKNQALVLVNYGESEGIDIYNLSSKIKNDILNKFDIELEREVNII